MPRMWYQHCISVGCKRRNRLINIKTGVDQYSEDDEMPLKRSAIL